MSKASKETHDAFKGCMTEVGANRTLSPSDDYNKGWNAGITESIKWMSKYQRGEGLFQVVADNNE